MTELLHHPVISNLLFCILAGVPLVRIYNRVGLPGWPALLILASMIIPFSGLLLALLPLLRAWPNFPKPVPPRKPVKVAI